MIEQIKERVPNKPGCYIYYNKKKEIIYIGKAKNLKKRMMSYFKGNINAKTIKLVNDIDSFDYVILNNEIESLIYENREIKKHQPKYNIALKDDKTYPYILLTNEESPRLKKVRKRKEKGTYFGPFTSGKFVTSLINYIGMNSKLRKCKNIPSKVCTYYHMNLCYAPCIKNIDPDEVNKYKKEVVALFDNNYSKLKKELKLDMEKASKSLLFEKALEYKELLDSIEEFKVKQIIEINKDKTFDLVSIYPRSGWVSIVIINIKNGIVDKFNYSIESYFEDYKDVVIRYLYDLYKDNSIDILMENEEIYNIIKDVLLINDVYVTKEEKLKLFDIGHENAREYYKKKVNTITSKYLSSDNGFEILSKLAGDNLEYIEMYDISHTAGTSVVGVGIMLHNGKFEKSLYRKYNLINQNDDYDSLRQMLNRKFNNIKLGKAICPNLIILDGGIGHVNIASEVLQEQGYYNDVKILGLVKDSKHKTKAMINKAGMKMDINDELYNFLYSIQEEVHRFAIDFHHKKNSNNMFRSELSEIKGIGSNRIRLLYDKFNDIETIKKLEIIDFINVGIPKNIAINIYEFFNKKND